MGGAFSFISAIAPIFSAVSTVFGGSLFGGGQQSAAPAPQQPVFTPPPVAPAAEDPAIQESADREKRRRASASGLSQTILTSGRGLTDDPTLSKKTLLGS